MALPHLRKLDLNSCDLGAQGCMVVAQAVRETDGIVLTLRDSGVSKVFLSTKRYSAFQVSMYTCGPESPGHCKPVSSGSALAHELGPVVVGGLLN